MCVIIGTDKVLKVECFARSVIEHVVIGDCFIPWVAFHTEFEIGVPGFGWNPFPDQVCRNMVVKFASKGKFLQSVFQGELVLLAFPKRIKPTVLILWMVIFFLGKDGR